MLYYLLCFVTQLCKFSGEGQNGQIKFYSMIETLAVRQKVYWPMNKMLGKSVFSLWVGLRNCLQRVSPI